MSELSAILTPFRKIKARILTLKTYSFILISSERVEEPGNP
jgi:hypothetical protein